MPDIRRFPSATIALIVALALAACVGSAAQSAQAQTHAKPVSQTHA